MNVSAPLLLTRDLSSLEQWQEQTPLPPEIWEKIFSGMSLQAIESLGATSRTWRWFKEHYIANLYSLDMQVLEDYDMGAAAYLFKRKNDLVRMWQALVFRQNHGMSGVPGFVIHHCISLDIEANEKVVSDYMKDVHWETNRERNKDMKEVRVAHGTLSMLPDFMSVLVNLEKIELPNNKFVIFPLIIIQIPRLKYLDISFNQIQYIPKKIKKLNRLETLILRGNDLRKLPNVLGKLKHLQLLDIRDNPSSLRLTTGIRQKIFRKFKVKI